MMSTDVINSVLDKLFIFEIGYIINYIMSIIADGP